MVKKRVIAILSTVMAILWGIGIACDNVRLSLQPKPLPQSSLALNEVCSETPVPSESPVKILFLIDMSGSNCTQNSIPPACDSSGTDPDKSYRKGLIEDFAKTHKGLSNISYGMIVFQNSAASALINEGTMIEPKFSNDPTDLDRALTQFDGMKDSGATPYKAAMSMAAHAIKNDVAKAPRPANYYVVLISDGQPTDYGDPLDQNQINADVKSLVDLAPRLSLSGIYYNQLNVTQDIAVIEGMSDAGGGGFSNVNSAGKKVPLEQIIALMASSPMVITQFAVANLNAAPCDDGTIGPDSDADGICDTDETAYNESFTSDPVLAARMKGKTFDPRNRNSFGPSYSDLFYYRHIVYAQELDAGCALTGKPYLDSPAQDLLNSCEKQFFTSKTPSGPTPLWTSAMKTSADPFNFDSDGDGILDWLELEFGRNPSNALNVQSIHSDYQGYSMYDIITQHRHPAAPKAGMPYDGVFKFSRVTSTGQNCYTYNQNVLPLYHTLPVQASQVSGLPQLAHAANENIILIYAIEKPENALEGPGLLRYYFQVVDTTVTSVSLQLDLKKYRLYTPDQSRVALALKAAGF